MDDIKLIDFYLYHDTLILATFFLAEVKSDHRKIYYFKDNLLFSWAATHGVRMIFPEIGEEFVDKVKKIIATELNK